MTCGPQVPPGTDFEEADRELRDGETKTLDEVLREADDADGPKGSDASE